MIRIIHSADRSALRRFLERAPADDRGVERRARTIVNAVRNGGDLALARFTRRLDGWGGPLEIGRDEMHAAARRVAAPITSALKAATAHLRRVSAHQLPRATAIRVRPGVTIEQHITPIDRVGCYVPGGRHALPSSLLMTAVPARVAGVREVIAVCPRPEPVVLAAAVIAGIDLLFRVGGAQAIAALAYGTETVPRVDKIVGPGNRYVTAAKALVSRDCAIDMHAGPTEIVVIANHHARWTAGDLVAQAEHDSDARSILVTTDAAFARRVARELERMADGTAARSLTRHGAIVVARNRSQAVEITNRLAPEHVLCHDARLAGAITNAGTVFVGRFSAPAAGDYATGSNHVLPTSGAARFRGGLSAADFVRVTSVQHLTRAGLRALAPAVVTLARAEGLEGHARSVLMRLKE